MADVVNHRIDQYADYVFAVVYTDDAGVAVDLTGWTADMKVKDKFGGSLLDEFSTGNGYVTTDPLVGKVIVNINNTKTAAWAWTSAVYDLVLTSGSGFKFRIIEGTILVNPGVTN